MIPLCDLLQNLVGRGGVGMKQDELHVDNHWTWVVSSWVHIALFLPLLDMLGISHLKDCKEDEESWARGRSETLVKIFP
jgi:hypothetical protein